MGVEIPRKPPNTCVSMEILRVLGAAGALDILAQPALQKQFSKQEFELPPGGEEIQMNPH